jgi:hypothetical protein
MGVRGREGGYVRGEWGGCDGGGEEGGVGFEAFVEEEVFGGGVRVDEDGEEVETGRGFDGFGEEFVGQGEELEDAAFDLVTGEVGIGVGVLDLEGGVVG